MIPDLLWRCPLCTANDALTHHQRWLRPETVTCTACGGQWRVRRAVGDNFYLKLVAAASTIETERLKPLLRTERSITDWYDLMKQTVRLDSIHDPHIALADGEALYLASGEAKLWAGEQASQVLKTCEVSAETGRLFLTNRRMRWQGENQMLDFELRQVNGIYAVVNLELAVAAGLRLYQIRFANESPLKWVTYAELVAQKVQAESGHVIRTSHY